MRTTERVERLFGELLATVDPDDPWSHPDAPRLDDASVASWLRSVGALPSTLRAVEAGALALAAGSSERTSLLSELRKAAAVGDTGFYSYDLWESFQVAEGSAEVALRMGEELEGRIRFGSEVVSIDVAAHGCRVTLSSGEEVRAEAVVCALPVSVLHGVRIEGVAPERLASLRAQRQARAAKVVTVYDRAVWADVGANGLSEGEQLLASTWPQRPGVLSGLVPPERVAWLLATAEDDRERVLHAELARMYGEEAAAPRLTFLRLWATDPLHAGVHDALVAGRRASGGPVARNARSALLRVWLRPVGRGLHGRRRSHRSRCSRRGAGEGSVDARLIEADVVVVGAGVAGLAAAAHVVAAGRSVVVLEARGRVGGRLWNTEIGGEANELGGEWVAPYHSRLHALLPELGIELFPAYRDGDDVYVDEAGRAHRHSGSETGLSPSSERALEEADAKLDALAKELDPDAPWAHPEARALDTITFDEWLRREVTDEVARENLRSYLADGFLTKPAHSFSLTAGAVGDRRRRWNVRALRRGAVPCLPGRRRLAADPDPSRRALGRSSRSRRAGACGPLVG